MLVGTVHDPVVYPLGLQPLPTPVGLIGTVTVHRPLITAHQPIGHLALIHLGRRQHSLTPNPPKDTDGR